MSSKSRRWPKVLLVSGLMLVLVEGLVRLPEVRGRLYPGFYWGLKLRLIQQESLKVERRLRYLGATLEELQDSFDPDGIQITPGPFKELLVLAQGWVNLPELWGHLLPKMTSYETKLRFVKKEFINVQRSLRHINATMETLNRALEHRPPRGATGSLPSVSSLNQALDITRAMRQRCWENKQELGDLLQKWQDLQADQVNKAKLKVDDTSLR